MKTNVCYHLILLVVIFLALPACKRPPQAENDNRNLPQSKVADTSYFTAAFGQVAKQITYDIIIKNANTYDTWTTTCLQGLDRKTFIDEIFHALYSGKLTARDYGTNKTFSVKKIHNLEDDILKIRSRIAKIQFTEDWFLDTTDLSMKKRVHSMVLGYEIYGDSGQVRGYKPAFKINFNTP